MTDPADPGAPRRVRVRVHGRVQGVWFRGSTRDAAIAHRVSGWVRNCRDGSVEAVFEGRDDAVDALLAFVRHGPPGARVERVEVAEESPAGERGFEFKP